MEILIIIIVVLLIAIGVIISYFTDRKYVLGKIIQKVDGHNEFKNHLYFFDVEYKVWSSVIGSYKIKVKRIEIGYLIYNTYKVADNITILI